MPLPSAPPLSFRRAAVVLVAAGVAACGADAPDAPRGIVLISIDSLRADHLSCYGYQSRTRPEIETTPNIDALIAGQGVLFTDASASTSWIAACSRSALLAGSLSAWRSGWSGEHAGHIVQERPWPLPH